jgi:hypothetical protein
MKQVVISVILLAFATVASAQKPRCVKWTWYVENGIQKKVVCLLWEKR